MGTQPFDHQRNAGIGIQINQIIKFAVCVDNKDPQRAGRIRAVGTKGEGLTQSKIADPLKFIIGEDNKALKEKTYVPWGIDDPYTFAPFLPLHLNIQPLPGEAVKIVGFGEREGNFNDEYIGPMISQPGEIRTDNYSSGQQNTSYGVQNKKLPDFAPNGIPLPEGKGCFPNPDDVALVGRENCDIVLGMREKSIVDETEEKLKDWYPQILIRSGQLIKNDKFSSRPRFNPKQTFIQLNTFPTTLTPEEVEVEKTVVQDVPLATAIEYHLDDASLQLGILTGFMRILKIPFDSNSKIYMSGDVTKETQFPSSVIEACRISFTNAPTTEELGGLLTDYISQYDGGEWSKFIKPPPSWATKTYHPQVDLNNQNNVGSFMGKTHPLYFKPDSVTLRYIDKEIPVGAPLVWPSMQTQANELKELITLDGVLTNGFGLAFTNDVGERNVKEEKVKETQTKINSQDLQQGIIAAGSEKIYLFSYNAAEINGRIQLDTNYGIDQEKFIVDVENKTNSLVRGEKLMELLTKMVNFVSSHTHAFPGLAPVPQGHDGTRVEDLTKLLQDAPNTILNQNIRIN
tara:strand:- start:1245 stop:2957 length:1713 start_codon:yes stop_codon:yes gene_type:complete|eukprot:COSAG01_NODE_250_length_20331_cov_203.745700_14_plen_571_part_00